MLTCLPSINRAGYFVIEGDHVYQALFASLCIFPEDKLQDLPNLFIANEYLENTNVKETLGRFWDKGQSFDIVSSCDDRFLKH